MQVAYGACCGKGAIIFREQTTRGLFRFKRTETEERGVCISYVQLFSLCLEDI